MGNFWQIMTALGAGDAAQQAGKAAKEAEKIKELQAKQNEIAEQVNLQNEELLELQKEHLKVATMTERQKLEYQEQKKKEQEREAWLEATFGEFRPDDPMVRKAVKISIEKGKFSTAMIQTYLGKGHNWVSGLADWLELLGVIDLPDGDKPRDILVSSLEEFDALAAQAVGEINNKYLM